MSSALTWLADKVFGGVYSQEEQDEATAVANLFFRSAEQYGVISSVYNALENEETGDVKTIAACYTDITEDCYGTSGDVLSGLLDTLNSVSGTITNTISNPLDQARNILSTAQADVEKYDSMFCSKHSGLLGGVTSIL